MLPYWCWSSLIRNHRPPALSDRYTPVTPSTVATAYTAGYRWPGAALPKPTLTAAETLGSLVKVAPESVDRNMPSSAVSQMSPSAPGTGLNLTPLVGRFAASPAVKL